MVEKVNIYLNLVAREAIIKHNKYFLNILSWPKTIIMSCKSFAEEK
jgi:hypothetical protein